MRLWRDAMEVRVFTKTDIESILGMPRAIELMRSAFAALSAGNVDSPVRTVLTNDRGTILYKPAWSESDNIFCAKIVSVFQGNTKLGLPVTPGIIVVNDGETGMPVAMMEAGYLTSLRTGAATGLATDLLAKPDASTAALFGTGGQAGHQLEAMLCVRQLQRVFVFSRKLSNATRFCDEMTGRLDLAGSCELVPSADHAVLESCDVITTATTSATPVFEDRHIGEAVHINAIGSLGPNRSEVPEATIARATIVVDQRAACLQEAGELLPLMADGRLPADFAPPELGELAVAEDFRPDQPITVFKSAGNAAQDLACAAEILKRADDESAQVIRF